MLQKNNIYWWVFYFNYIFYRGLVSVELSTEIASKIKKK